MTEDSSLRKETFEERLDRETRPPNGQRLILHSLRFAEIIKADDYERLGKGLDLLYEGVLGNRYSLSLSSEQKIYRSFLVDARRAFLSSRWANLPGFVSKTFADAHRQSLISSPIRELPSGVEGISFFMCQRIPSSIVVVVHVTYQSTISDSLNELLTKEYSDRIERLQSGSTIQTPADRIKEEAIRNFFLEVQSKAESFISSFFKGVFLSDTSKEVQARCPSVKLFSLQSIPFTPKGGTLKRCGNS